MGAMMCVSNSEARFGEEWSEVGVTQLAETEEVVGESGDDVAKAYIHCWYTGEG